MTRSKSAVVDVPAYLKTRDKDSLIELLLEAAGRDDVLDTRLRLDAARASAPQGAQAAVDAHRAAIDEAFSPGGYVRYREAYDYSLRLEEAVHGLRSLLEAGHAAAVMELAEHAIDRLGENLGYVDDSDGNLGVIAEQLGELHLDACAATRPDPVELAARLFAREIGEDDLEVFYGAATRYADVLGSAGLAEYRRRAEQAWAQLPTLAPGQRGSFDTSRFRLSGIMESLAEIDEDVDAVVDVLAQGLSSSYQFVRIGERLVQAERFDDARTWLERGHTAFGEGADHRLDEALAAEYHRGGQPDKAVELFWRIHSVGPNPTTYHRLREQSERADCWTVRRDDAYAVLEAAVDARRKKAGQSRSRTVWGVPADGSDLVTVLLDEGRAGEAWALAQDRGCTERLWRRLAQLREQTHPDDAIPIWQRAIEQSIELKKNHAYDEAVRLMGHVETLLTAAGRVEAFGPYITEIRVRHKPKRNLMKLMDSQRW